MGEVRKVARLSDREDKKCYRDREYAVTEGFDASLVHAAFYHCWADYHPLAAPDHGWRGQLSP